MFFLIPLILSIGIAPAIPFSDAQETLENIYRDDSMTECRDGQWLVLRIPQNNYVCTLDTTAQRWVQLGMAEIISRGEIQETLDTIEESIPMMEPEEHETHEHGIEIPPYPDKPSIHPNLLASNEFWMPVGVHKVTDRVYSAVGFAFANTIMIEGDDGLIIVDTQDTYESGKKVMSEFRKITDKPVVSNVQT